MGRCERQESLVKMEPSPGLMNRRARYFYMVCQTNWTVFFNENRQTFSARAVLLLGIPKASLLVCTCHLPIMSFSRTETCCRPVDDNTISEALNSRCWL